MTNKNFLPILGLIGGAGPDACIDIQNKILLYVKQTKNVFKDGDFPRVIVDNNTTLANRDKQFLVDNQKVLVQQLSQTLEIFERFGVTTAAIACNSAHIYFEEIQLLTKIKLIHIIEVVKEYLISQNILKVGLLSSLSTYTSQLYEEKLSKYGISTIVPNDLNKLYLSQCIYAIKANKFYEEGSCNVLKNKLSKLYNVNMVNFISKDYFSKISYLSPVNLLQKVIEDLIDQGAKKIILGCTELPLLQNFYDKYDIEFIDPNYIIAKSLVMEYNNNIQKNIIVHQNKT